MYCISLNQKKDKELQNCPIKSTVTKYQNMVVWTLLYSCSACQLDNKERLKWEPRVVHKDGYQLQVKFQNVFFVCLIRWDFFHLLKLAGPQISKDEIENFFTFNNEISCHTKNSYQK